MKSTLVVTLSFVCAACSHDHFARSPAREDRAVGSTTTTSAVGGRIDSPNLALSSDLARRCNAHFDAIDEAPRFAFDAAALDPQDRAVLALVAKCVTDGPLAGRAVRLVGHTDRRGETEYNLSLGARRAEAAERYLIQLGVQPTRVHETSRGELDASGDDEAGFARDRRVDVELE